MTFVLWMLGYALPAAVAVYWKSRYRNMRVRVLILHVGIVTSIALMSLIGARIVWHSSTLSVVAFCVSVIAAAYLLGNKNGGMYAISSIIQEWCILLAGIYLAGVYGILFGATATALVFALAHRATEKQMEWKWPLLAVWGFVSILLYQWLGEPLLNISVHTLGGALLIYKGFLYTNE